MKYIAMAVATAMAVGMAMPTFAVWAEGTEPAVVEVTPSEFLADKAGSLQVTVSGERDLRVKVEKQTPDGKILYYNTLLENDGIYSFSLDSCEYNLDTEAYDSSFSVTVQDEGDALCAYTLNNMVVLDTGFTTTATTTEYAWDVTSTEADVRVATAVATAPAILDSGVYFGSCRVTLDYLSYTMGDVDENGKVEIQDAFLTLMYSSKQSAGEVPQFTDGSFVKKENAAFAAADVNKDMKIEIQDAFLILMYSSVESAGGTPTWEN